MPWLRFHALRHLTGTLLAEAGVPERIIQEWLGHATGRMTQHYTRSVRLRRAARVLERSLAGMGRGLRSDRVPRKSAPRQTVPPD